MSGFPCPYCTVPVPAGETVCPGCEHAVEAPRLSDRAVARLRMLHCFSLVLMAGLWIVGFLVQMIGFIFWLRPEGRWLSIVGGGAQAAALTVAARMRGRDWKWGLLGFLSFAGVLVFFLHLRSRCPRCGEFLGGGDRACGRCGAAVV